MSFNRINYDSSAYNLQINQSIGPGDYRIFGLFAEHNNPCFSDIGVGSRSDPSLVKNLDDLTNAELTATESNLTCRNRKLCKTNKIELDEFKTSSLKHKKPCSKQLYVEDTRFTHPIDNYRSMSLTEYYYEPYLHINPQCHIKSDRIGLNSRLHSKDTYILPIETTWDSGEALPIEKKEEKKICSCKYLCDC
jgi:hypothetical protein